jgi:alpha-1,2-glucosyltransferase
VLGIALLGAYGVLCRQTNIVWLFFVAGRYVFERVFAEACREKKSAAKLIRHSLSALLVLTPITMVGAFFVYFVVVANNGSIVLGDSGNHQPAFHLAQLVYFFCAVPLFFPFQALSAVRKAALSINFRSAAALCSLMCFFTFTLQSFCFFHKYLVSDNRHYTFYLYRRVLADVALRTTLLPPIATVGAATFVDVIFHTADHDTVVRRMEASGGSPGAAPSMIATWRFVSVAEMLLLVFCTSVACVPQELLEFRYFVPSLMVMQLLRATRRQYEPRVDERVKIADVVFLAVVHCVTAYVFTYRVFTAPDGTEGRFMW